MNLCELLCANITSRQRDNLVFLIGVFILSAPYALYRLQQEQRCGTVLGVPKRHKAPYTRDFRFPQSEHHALFSTTTPNEDRSSLEDAAHKSARDEDPRSAGGPPAKAVLASSGPPPRQTEHPPCAGTDDLELLRRYFVPTASWAEYAEVPSEAYYAASLDSRWQYDKTARQKLIGEKQLGLVVERDFRSRWRTSGSSAGNGGPFDPDESVLRSAADFNRLIFSRLKPGWLFVFRVVDPTGLRIVQRLLELVSAGYPAGHNPTVGIQLRTLACVRCGVCVVEKELAPAILKQFTEAAGHEHAGWYRVAKTTKTDKITVHSYHGLYGKYLSPAASPTETETRTEEPFGPMLESLPLGPMLEIGLGCTMDYGPGESAKIWTKIFVPGLVHFVEYNGDCVEKHREAIEKEAYAVHTGDQADVKFLERLKFSLGYATAVVVDDGGHFNTQMMASFFSLWPTVLSGGLYFIEDWAE